MTRKILLVSDDEDFKGFLKIAALTLTKLNHQITITEDRNDGYLDWVIIDMDSNSDSNLDFIITTRKSETNKNIKIVSVITNITNELRVRLFQSGCDSIMTKKEFRAAANNILIF